jgi:hypothetical protein
MKKTTIATNRLIAWLKGLIKEDRVDLQDNYSQIITLFNYSNFIATTPIERIELLKKVSSKIRHELDKELELAESNALAIRQFKKEPYISNHKEIAKGNYDFLAMHNIEFLRDGN